MPLKHLEHRGNEDFGTVLNRAAVKAKIKKLRQQSDENKEERLEKQQEKYNHSENPALWDGEI